MAESYLRDRYSRYDRGITFLVGGSENTIEFVNVPDTNCSVLVGCCQFASRAIKARARNSLILFWKTSQKFVLTDVPQRQGVRLRIIIDGSECTAIFLKDKADRTALKS